jgi:hypothetical protein
MAKNSIRDYDATSGNNTDVQSVDISEGCAASGINNALREIMTDLKNVSTGAVALETPAADQLNVDNIRIDGNTISSTDTNGNVNIDPAGTGDVIVTSAETSSTANLTVQNTNASGQGAVLRVKAANTNANSKMVFDDGGTESGFVFDGGANAVQHFVNGSERLRVDSNGHTLFGQSSTDSPGVGNTTAGAAIRGTGISFFSASGSAPGRFNRSGDDGVLIAFYQAGTQEGTISVSGTTVSYNGGHLARFSQATDSNRIDGLVKGTVMTNLDQMAVWHHEAQAATYYTEDDELPDGVSVGDEKTPAVAAYDEENEQLNCMAVSSVEGDANVAGVFVNWDDDDEDYTADMNVAMTGDMVIRIASGTTVARGDLLMSAGDGTAKPQDDDIVRSKTIAKVTSTTVSHTYDDGTYLVPCVLMAC